jgi:transcriptional regulator with XRE-family HTH domain
MATSSRDPATSPPKFLGDELRRARVAAGYSSQEALAAQLGFDRSVVGKAESGERVPSPEVLAAWCAAGQVDAGLFTRMALLARSANGPFPTWFARWPDAEAAARTLRSFEPLAVPGLLQTEDYARAWLSTRVGESREQIDDMVAARVARQQILERDEPPTCWFIVDEGVLRRCVGSPVVMKEQLNQLAHLAQRPDIVVQVVPLDAGAHQGLNAGGFVIADLPGAVAVAYQDTALAGQILESADDIESLMLTWDTLRSEALPRVASMALIERVQESWT